MVANNIEVAVFDLDGTLINQDSLLEQTFSIIKIIKLRSLYLIPLLLFKGRIHYKKFLFAFNEKLDKNATAMKNITSNPKVLNFFHEYKAQGSKVIVATAAYSKTAIKVLSKIKLLPIETCENFGNIALFFTFC